ncbi:MAG: thiamine-phosphate kinase [Bacteroidales bacterium]|nr:thiamine-phosphate kinase [Bacteroidales bacterium]
MAGKKTKISELGEFGLIEHIAKDIKLKNKSSAYGIGDDAAVLDYEGKKLLVTTDLLVEGIHFNLMYTPLKHLGYKAATVNFSDIYAMNGHPRQMTISLAISNKFTVEAIDEIYGGIKIACDQYGVDLVGGDTSSSLTGLILSITVIGEVEENNIVFRSTAKNNDLICVSGNLGASYLGLQVLEREKIVFETNPNEQPDLTDYEYILQRQLKPEARKDIIDLLKNLEILPTSMIDISDGLSSEILHICKGSKAGCKIFQDKIPIRPETIKAARELNIEPLICALNGGDDYELLFTIALNDFEKIKNIPDISIIGHICEEKKGRFIITPDGNTLEIIAQGWNSFNSE